MYAIVMILISFINLLRSTHREFNMNYQVKITILKSELDKELVDRYAIANFEACPFHKAGQVFISDGDNKPDGLCEYAWKPIQEMVKLLSEGKLLQPKGTWMKDDDKGVFSCVDGLRPVIMLIERIQLMFEYRKMESRDDEIIAKIIRNNLEKLHLNIPRTAYFDK